METIRQTVPRDAVRQGLKQGLHYARLMKLATLDPETGESAIPAEQFDQVIATLKELETATTVALSIDGRCVAEVTIGDDDGEELGDDAEPPAEPLPDTFFPEWDEEAVEAVTAVKPKPKPLAKVEPKKAAKRKLRKRPPNASR